MSTAPVFGKPKTTAEMTVRTTVAGAPPMPSTSVRRTPFTPTTIMVKYTRTNRNPWRFSHVIIADDSSVADPERRADIWSHRRLDVAAMPEWVRDFVESNAPGGQS